MVMSPRRWEDRQEKKSLGEEYDDSFLYSMYQ
jgi:hypothetical protein